MKVKRKANAFIYIAAATVLSLSLFAGLGNSATSAHADAAGDNYFERTDVLDDLDAMTVDGKDASFSLDGADDGVKVVSLLEYCYSAVGQNEQYGLYLYIHTQDYVAFESNSQLNKITLSYDGGERYKKYALKYLSENSTPEEVGKFYKYKVNFTAAERAEVLKGVDRAKREYRVSEIELKQPRQSKATAYYVATNYRYTGFANGYGGGVSTAALKCEQQELDTVELDVRSTYYRYPQTLSSGVQINSVYFAIDNKYLSRYGTLYKIWAEYERRDLAPIVVTAKKEFYDWLREDAPLRTSVFGGQTDYLIYGYENGGGSKYETADWVYGWGNYFELFGGTNITLSKAYERCLVRPLAYLAGDSRLDDEDISREYIENEIKYAAEKFGEYDAAYGDYYEHKEIALTQDDLFDVKGFNASAGFAEWWYALFHHENADLTNISPICKITNADLNASDMSERLLIASEDVGAFKTFCTEAALEDKTVWLFRYGTSEYSSKSGKMLPTGFSVFQSQDVHLRFEKIDRNFDIIQLGFKNDKQLVIIPVAASPVDVIGGSISNVTTLDKLNGGNIFKKAADEAGSFFEALLDMLKDMADHWWIWLAVAGGVVVLITIIVVVGRRGNSEPVIVYGGDGEDDGKGYYSYARGRNDQSGKKYKQSKGKNGRKKTTKRR